MGEFPMLARPPHGGGVSFLVSHFAQSGNGTIQTLPSTSGEKNVVRAPTNSHPHVGHWTGNGSLDKVSKSSSAKSGRVSIPQTIPSANVCLSNIAHRARKKPRDIPRGAIGRMEITADRTLDHRRSAINQTLGPAIKHSRPFKKLNLFPLAAL